jgi:hypothetical protein
VHYADSQHAEWWKEEIAKRGSLEAVYRYIERRLRKDMLEIAADRQGQ